MQNEPNLPNVQRNLSEVVLISRPWRILQNNQLSIINNQWKAPAMTCQKCNELSVFQAVKCIKCGLAYEKGSIFSVHGDVDDYPDRCPECRYSPREERRGVVYKPSK